MTAPVAVEVSTSPLVPKEILEKITGCKVISHTVEDGTKPGDNYMSILYSVSAVLIPPGGSEADKETRHFLLKCYPNHPARQTYLNKSNIFHNELNFYQVWAKELVNFQKTVVGNPDEKIIQPAFPPCEGGVAVNYKDCEPDVLTKVYDPLDNFIMMVDLRKTWGFKMADRRAGLGYEHIKLVFRELATIHALSWAYRKKVETDLVKKFPFLNIPFDKEDMEMWGRILDANVDTACNTLDTGKETGGHSHLSQSTRMFQKKMMKVIQFFISQGDEDEKSFWDMHTHPPKEMVEASANDEPWRIICHGDSWCNNMLFKDNDKTGKPERVILVDFQLTREACPTADLVYNIYTSTTGEFRRAHLEEVLQLYHDRFVEVCNTLKTEPLPGFSMESLKRRFHRSKPMGYMMALIGLPIMLIDKGQEINLEEMGKEVEMEEMFIDAFSKGGVSSAYKQRLTEVAQELYEQGVI